VGTVVAGQNSALDAYAPGGGGRCCQHVPIRARPVCWTGEQSAQVIGLSAAVVLGMSAFFFQFLYELRVYVFIVLATIWFIWFYWRLRQQNHPSILVQVLFVVSVAASLYSTT